MIQTLIAFIGESVVNVKTVKTTEEKAVQRGMDWFNNGFFSVVTNEDLIPQRVVVFCEDGSTSLDIRRSE